MAKVLESDVSSQELSVDARLCLDDGLWMAESAREGSESVRLLPDFEKV